MYVCGSLFSSLSRFAVLLIPMFLVCFWFVACCRRRRRPALTTTLAVAVAADSLWTPAAPCISATSPRTADRQPAPPERSAVPSAHPKPFHPLNKSSTVKYRPLPAARECLHSYISNISRQTPTLPHYSTQQYSNSQLKYLGMSNDIDMSILLIRSGIETNPGPALDQVSQTLTIAHININSITAQNKLDELQHCIDTNGIQIIALTETKLDDTVDSSLYKIQGFHSPLTRHRNRHGGGVAIYVHASLPVKRLTGLELGGHEWIWAKIKLNTFTLVMCCSYLPPNLTAEDHQLFTDNLAEALCQAQAHFSTATLVLGDFNTGNIYLQRNTYRHSGITAFDHKLKDVTDAYDLKQLIKEPTRIAGNTENLRDLIFTSNDNITIESGTLSPFAQLDHFPTFVSLQVPTLPKHCEPITKRIWDYPKINIPLLTDTLLNTDWASILEHETNTATDLFISALQDAARVSIPIKQLKLKQDQNPG